MCVFTYERCCIEGRHTQEHRKTTCSSKKLAHSIIINCQLNEASAAAAAKPTGLSRAYATPIAMHTKVARWMR